MRPFHRAGCNTWNRSVDGRAMQAFISLLICMVRQELKLPTIQILDRCFVQLEAWRRVVIDFFQIAPSPGFYVNYQYERAYKFLEWMTSIVHTNNNYRNVGMLEILNEPVRGSNSQTNSMRQTYYPTAWARIRAAEAALNISPNSRLHIQMMVRHSSLLSVYSIVD